MKALAAWQNFYVIAGSSAGALIGLQFVVLSLIADLPRARANPQAGAAFSTPTTVHFAVVLGLSGMFSAPWDSIEVAATLWGLAGLGGVIYEIVVIRRMRGQSAYKPELEDWLGHAILPCAAYLALAASAYAAQFDSRKALFGAAAAMMLLLFVGIHNTWDAVTYHVFVQRPRQAEEKAGERQ